MVCSVGCAGAPPPPPLDYNIVEFIFRWKGWTTSWWTVTSRAPSARLWWDRGLDIKQQEGLHLQGHFERRHLGLATLGYGAASLQFKVVATCHMLALESGSAAMYKRMRWQVRCWVSDQGVEAGIADAPDLFCDDIMAWTRVIDQMRQGDLVLNEPETLDQFLFPLALAFPDCLHMIFGQFESAVKSLSAWSSLESSYRALASFLSNRSLRQRFQKMCLKGADSMLAAMFDAFSPGSNFDWKWQYWEKFSSRLVQLLPIMSRTFSVQAMGHSGDDVSRVYAGVIQDVSAALRDNLLLWKTYMLLATARQLDHFGTWCEGCWCHQYILDDTSRPLRQRTLAYKRESAGCPWKGRRMVELCAGALEIHLARVGKATSAQCQAAMAEVQGDGLLILQQMEQELKTTLISHLRSKFAFVQSLPVKLLGLYIAEQGGSIMTARRVATEVLEEVEQARALGRLAKLHRVAQRFLVEDQTLRSQIVDLSLGGELGLELKVELRAYAMALCVTRRTEAVHASLKREMARSSWMLPALVFSRLRESSILEALDSKPFLLFCVKRWRRRGLHKLLLSYVFRKRSYELFVMPKKKTWQHIFLSGFEQQFEQDGDRDSVMVAWTGAASSQLKPSAVPLTSGQSACITLIKSRMLPHSVWSVPRPVADAFGDTSIDATVRPIDNEVQLFGAILGLVNEAPIPDPSGAIFFRVVSVDRLKALRPAHLDALGATMVVEELDVASVSTDGQVVARGGHGKVLVWCLHRLANLTVLAGLQCWHEAHRDVRPVLSADMVARLRESDMAPGADLGALSLESQSQKVLGVLREGGGGASVVDVLCKAEGVAGAEVLPALAKLGVIRLTDDEFGQQMVSWGAAPMHFAIELLLDAPEGLCSMGMPTLEDTSSKMSLVCELLRQGWSVVDMRTEHVPGGLPHFDKSMVRYSRFYFAALLSRDHVFEKGVKSFPSRAPGNFYRCLLELPSSRLAELVAIMPDLSDYNDKAFAAFLQGKPLQTKPLAIDGAQAPDAEDQEEDEGPPSAHESAAAVVSQDMDMLPIEDVVVHRRLVAPMRCFVGDILVKFDGASHSSGLQRGYFHCAHRSHGVCIKYRQVNLHPTWQHCAAWLVAWHELADGCEEKADHLGCEPCPDRVMALVSSVVAG